MDFGRNRLFHLLCVVILPVALLVPTMAADQNQYKPLFKVRIDHEFAEPQKAFEELKALILNHYYTRDIDEASLYWGAAQGMLRRISPPDAPELCQIWTPDQYGKVVDSLKGEQVSLGIKSTLNPADGSLTVTEVVAGGPSENVLQPQDRILRIDGAGLKEKSLDEVNNLIGGKENQRLGLTVNRDIQILELTVVLKRFDPPNLVVTRLDKDTAVVELRAFTAEVSKTLRAELERLRNDKIKALIVDLRNNPGGVFIESLRIAEFFLPKDSVLLRTLQRDTDLQNYVSVNTDPFTFDLALLVNPKTASSAEILTACLQDHQKATVIGTRTFGKGIFDKTFELQNHIHVKLITGAMYSPKGVSWHGKGILPDFLVEQDEATLTALLKVPVKQRLSKDVAMITASKLLKRK